MNLETPTLGIWIQWKFEQGTEAMDTELLSV